MKHCFFPTQGRLHASGRLVFAFAANIALAFYVIPRRIHLNDVGDFQYVQLRMMWLFLVGVIPPSTLVVTVPVLMSKRPVHRLLAVVLSAFPAYLTLVEWHQHLSNAASGRYS